MPHIALPEGVPGIRSALQIAAAFCMFNRSVDGLATWTPDDPDFYRQRAALAAEHGCAGATLGVKP